MKFLSNTTYILAASASTFLACSNLVMEGVCTFNSAETCTLYRDILNDKSSTGLPYYAPTNYNHTISGEIEIFNSSYVSHYTDGYNIPGQLRLMASKTSIGSWRSGEIMTRANLIQAPYNAPFPSLAFTTSELCHGYVEAVVKLPKCVASDDGLCQTGTNPLSYNNGLWPSLWLLPTMDTNWPQNGEIDVFEAYKTGLNFNTTTATLHFNGTDPSCTGGDCVYAGYPLTNNVSANPLWQNFHTFGLEWQPDTTSTDGGVILTGYFDNNKVWGPLATDSLPADGPNAFSRGFNDPNGGFYVIAALAIGGPYAGAPSPHLQKAYMYVQSLKAYAVTTGSTNNCQPPANIQSMYEPDKTQVTLAWEAPANSDPIQYYTVSDWQNKPLWQGTSSADRAFQDQSLPGTTGTYTYYLATVCTTGTSTSVKYDVTINLKAK